MRKLFISLAVFFAVVAIAFTVFPMGTIAFLPVGLTLILTFLALKFSVGNQKILPKILLFISLVTLLVVVGKVVFINDKVAVDKQFEQQKVESEKQDVKDLEGLE